MCLIDSRFYAWVELWNVGSVTSDCWVTWQSWDFQLLTWQTQHKSSRLFATCNLTPPVKFLWNHPWLYAFPQELLICMLINIHFLSFDFLILKQPPWEAVAINKVDDLLESFLGIRDPELGRQYSMINCLIFQQYISK